MFSNGRTGQNIWVHEILSRYAENSVSEVDPRLENKNTEILSKLENAYIISEALKPTTLASGNDNTKLAGRLYLRLQQQRYPCVAWRCSSMAARKLIASTMPSSQQHETP